MRFRPDTRARRSRTLKKQRTWPRRTAGSWRCLPTSCWQSTIRKALSIAEKAAGLAPNDAIVQSVLALAYGTDAQWEKAKQAAQSPRSWTRSWRGRTTHSARCTSPLPTGSTAQAALEQAVKLEPKAVRWRLALAAVLETGEENGPAPARVRAVIKLVPDHPRALIRSALLHLQNGSTQVAKDKLARAVKVAPNAWETRLAQGYFAANEENYSGGAVPLPTGTGRGAKQPPARHRDG